MEVMMVKKTSPLEGKIVVLEYTEADFFTEDTACLVYRVKGGKLLPLYGVLDLPQEVGGWHTASFDQLDEVVRIINVQGVTEVYTPLLWTGSFLGQSLGEFDISDEPNEKGEIECWGKLGGVSFAEIENGLIESGIALRHVDGENFEIYPNE